VKDVNDREAPGVEQNQAATDYDVAAIGWWRRQSALQFRRTRLILLSQTGRKRAVDHQLSFQAGRQAVALGESGRKVIMMVAIPASHLIAIAIVVTVMAMAPTMIFILILTFAPIIVIIVAVVFVVAVAVSLSGDSNVCPKRKRQDKQETQPSV
jgi:hypothetical protein